MSNINKNSIEKVFDKRFKPLEDNANNLSKELVLREIENLPPVEDEYEDEDIITKRNAVKEYLKGNLKELGSAEKVGTGESYEFKVVILENFRTLYIKKDDMNHPVPIGIWLDLWERDHSSYFGVREYIYKELPINERANLEAQLQLYLWVNKEYYTEYTRFYLPKEYDTWFDEINPLCDKRNDYWSCINEQFKQKLHHHIQKNKSQLTGNDIFIEPGKDTDVYGEHHEYVYISPDLFLEKVAKLWNIDMNQNTSHDIEISKKYAKDMLRGDKFPIPVVHNVMHSDRIDGWHRVLAAKELGVEMIPVLMITESKINKISQLTGNVIFDITTTGMPFYDSMLHKEYIAGNRDPVEYFKTNKGLLFEIVWMSPTQYLEESYKIHRKFSIDYGIPQITFETYLKTNIDPDLINEYVQRTLEGSKMPMPVLDYDKLTQEGRHRAVVAKELGVEKIPVLVVRTYEGD